MRISYLLHLRALVPTALLASAAFTSNAFAQPLNVTGTTTLPADTIATYDSITVQSGGTLDIGGGSVITVTGALTINAGGTVLCRSKDITSQVNGVWAGTGVTIHAGSATIAATGTLSADGQGYINGIGPGFPTGLAATTAYRTGASHGGTGTGTGFVQPYGNGYEPTTPGQGAAFYDNEQTAGGGAIRLIVDGTLTLNGEISADGTGTPAASAVFHGGATGGSLWITAGVLTGAGRFTADARSAAYNTAVTSYGQSSGGRIAVYAGSDAGFTGWPTTTVNAGGGTAQTGSLVVALGAPGSAAMRIVTRANFPVDAQLALQSLTLEPNTTLALGGGTNLAITGALILGDNASLLCEGTKLSAQVDGVWAGDGVSISAGSATIPATAKISADGQGYRNAVGPGMSPTLAPTSVEARRAGASHGGEGTGGGTDQPVMPVYGSSLQPTTPGQGAGGAVTDFVAGGGAIRLIVDGTLTLDGTITANGVSTGTARGGATGGSIWVTTGTLAGSGRFAADAVAGTGTYLGHSGGGRIAVYYEAEAGFGGFLTSTVNASNVAGQAGTLVFVDTSVAGGGAVRVSQRMTLDDGPVFSAGSLIVENGATLSVGPRVALDIEGTLTVTGNSTVHLASADVLAAVDGAWVGTGAHIEASNVHIATGSKISVDGEGYRNAVGPGMSPTLAPTSVEARRAGASHGGKGTGGGTNQPVMPVYGSSLQPTTPGQGAGGATTDFVAGGGAIRLIVDGTLTLDGTITSNGVSTGSARGGATGGSIWVTTGTLAGSGRFAADAVAGTGTYLGDSGGGRIAVYYGTDAGFGGFVSSTVNASSAAGQAGTLVFIDTSVTSGGAMRVNQRMTLDAGPIFSLGALTIGNGATVEVAGGVALDIGGTLTLTGDSTLQLRSQNNLGQVEGGWLGTGAIVMAGDVTIAAGSRISVDGEGYRNGNGPGFPVGLPVASAYRTGASYGGHGTGTGALPPSGEPLEPVMLGTGAAIYDDEVTAGGGALRLIVDGTLTLDGRISADGIATAPGFQVFHGGATGGSLWVTTRALTGSGRFSADAHPSVFINGYGGYGDSSGGRIAVYYESATGFSGMPASSTSPLQGDAEAGTVLFIQDNGGEYSARAFARLDVPEGRTLELHGLTLEDGARLDIYGGSTLRVAGMFDIKDDALVNFWSRNSGSSFADTWIGEGGRIDAGDMRVAATAILTADGQGYRDGMGPGGPNLPEGVVNIGGSYGGKGSGVAAKEPYGSLVAPRDLGSAGAYNRNATHPNTSTKGGGAIFLNVDRSLELNGVVTAAGTVIDTTHAGATGGSILVRADRLSGSGLLNADAAAASGSNQSAGGRIAIWSTTNSLPASNVSARAGGATAQNGTIHYAPDDAIAWIRSPLEVFSGPTRLDWITTGSASTVAVDILVQPASGPAVPLATGLGPTASYLWNTTALDDGLYTLIAQKRDARTGAILGSDTRTVTLLNNALVLRGTITESITIPAGKVSFIIGPIVIPAGVTVTAEPGAIVKVSLGSSVLVEAGGALIALGTEPAPIVFTSIVDDTVGGDSNFDGSATAPGVVDWNGLRSNGGTITFNEFAEVRHAVEMVDNDITTTVRWRAGSVRVITRQIDIIQSGALTIEPGAIVKFARNTGIRVTGGTLAVEGSLLRPVIFTSEKDDTVGGDSNGDGSLTTPIPGDWYGIYFEDTTSTFRHAEFRYGAESWAGFRGLLDIRTADLLFESCRFVDILFEVAYLQSDHGGTATFENCIFTRVDRPIFANRGSVVTVRNCVFDSTRRALHYSGGRIDVYNSAITNSLTTGVLVDSGATITDFFNNAFWNPRATGGNVTGATIAIGANGVVEGDPKFVNRGALDFRVLEGSALIDAGSAAHGTPGDYRGFARLGSAPEIGAYEFTSAYTSSVDLVAEISGPPTSALSGASIDLTVLARNAGTAAVTGPWRHAIFLRPAGGGADIPVAEFVDQPAATLSPGGAATFTTRVTVPDGLVGLYRFGVAVNSREEIFEGVNVGNNTAVAATPTVCDVPELPFGGSVTGRFFRSGESRVFKVRPASPGQTMHLVGDTEPTRGFTQLLIARGRVPTIDDFDAQSPQWDQPDATVSISGSADDWYYVRIVASELRVPTTTFTLSARAVEFQLTGLGITTVGSGPVTIGVLGADLRDGATVTLRPVGGATGVTANDVIVTGGTSADASFDLTGVAAGLYDVIVAQGDIERVLPGSLRVSSASPSANIITTVAGPGVNRVGFPYFAAVTARNTGTADAPAPIITLSGPGMPVDLNDPESPFFGYGYAEGDTGRDFFLAIPATGNPAILPAGRSAEAFIAQGITPDGSFTVSTKIIRSGDTTPFDLVGYGAQLRPVPKPDGWDESWAMIAGNVPQTLGGLADLCASAADLLYRTRGLRSNNVAEILHDYVADLRIALLGTVSGHVRWESVADTGPLEGIRISLVGVDSGVAASTTTFKDGSFTFNAVAPGLYDWRFENAVAARIMEPLSVEVGTSISGVDIPLRQGTSARVRILPVAGVEFPDIEATLFSSALGIGFSVAPDTMGNATFRGLPQGVYILTVSAPDRPPVVQRDVSISLGSANDLGSVILSSTVGTVKGKVLQSGNLEPVSDAVIALPGSGSAARTATDGSFVISSVPVGTWSLTTRATGFAPATLNNITVAASSETAVDIQVLPGASIAGTVIADGTALEGVSVRALLGDDVLGDIATNNAGEYAFADLPAGTFTLTFAKPGFSDASTTIALGSGSTVNVGPTVLEASSRIRGQLQSTAGAAVPGVAVYLVQEDGSVSVSTSNRDGVVGFAKVSPGTHEVQLLDGSSRQSVTMPPGSGALVEITIQLDVGGITGHFVAQAGGDPLYAEVVLLHGTQKVSTGYTGEDGTFAFTQVKPGDYSIMARTSAHEFGPIPVTVAEGQTFDLGGIVAPAGNIGISIRSQPALWQSVDTEARATLVRRFEDGQNFSIRKIPFAAGESLSVTGLERGRYWLMVQTGFSTSGWIPVDLTGTSTQIAVDISEAGIASGIVQANSSTPIEGAEVTLIDTTDRTRHYIAITGANGRFAIMAPYGTYELWAGAPFHETGFVGRKVRDLTLSSSGPVATTVTLASTTATISGLLATPDGSGVPRGGMVRLLTPDRAELAAAYVDDEGGYALPLPAAGTYALEASAQGYRFTALATTVTTDSVIDANLIATWHGGIENSTSFEPAPLAQSLARLVDTASGEKQAMMVSAVGEDAIQWGEPALDPLVLLQMLNEFREWLAQNVFGKPPPSEPAIVQRPPGLYDPDCPCPAAVDAWREMLRRQRAAEERYWDWQTTWSNQTDVLAGLVLDFGVNLGKVALSAKFAGMGSKLDAAADAAKRSAIAASDDFVAAQRAIDKSWEQGTIVADEIIAKEQAAEAMWDAARSAGEAQSAVDAANLTLSQLGLGVTTGAGGLQLFGSNPAGGNPVSGLLQSLSDLPTAMQSLEGINSAIGNMASFIQLAEQLNTIVRNPQYRGNPVIANIATITDAISAIASTVKLVQGILENTKILLEAKERYYDMLQARDRAYQAALRNVSDCQNDCPPPEPPDDPKPPKPPGGGDGGSGRGRGDKAHDPNSKYTIGYGDEGWVRPDEPLIYTITFENIAEAGLAAQRVIITDQLDAKLDWSTFELLAAGFNRTSFAIPPGLQRYTRTANVATDPNPVKCDFHLNPATGLFTIDLRSVDAVTGGFPRDSLAGFLPPNDAMHRGEGFVTFMIKPKAGQIDNTQIRNIASIVFDTNEAIITNEAINTLDATPPQGRVTTLASRSGTSFQVSWGASELGSGAVAYSVWVSRNGGPWELWQNDTSATSATFTGVSGSTYRFFATARDAVGWSDSATFNAQASTEVAGEASLINMSTRALAGAGDDTLVLGFYIEGTGSKTLLIRGIGPKMLDYGVTNVVGDPALVVYSGQNPIEMNDDWDPSLAADFVSMGAFALDTGSADAALKVTLPPGGYTVHLVNDGLPAEALIEIYDFSRDAGTRLVNLSCRLRVAVGETVIVGASVINDPMQVVLRGAGPALEEYGVAGFATDTHLRVFSGQTEIAANDDWDESLEDDFSAVGAFPFPPASKDAALRIELQPGGTTVHATVKEQAGVVLVELYEGK